MAERPEGNACAAREFLGFATGVPPLQPPPLGGGSHSTEPSHVAAPLSLAHRPESARRLKVQVQHPALSPLGRAAATRRVRCSGGGVDRAVDGCEARHGVRLPQPKKKTQHTNIQTQNTKKNTKHIIIRLRRSSESIEGQGGRGTRRRFRCAWIP